jgi:hypothetical protein
LGVLHAAASTITRSARLASSEATAGSSAVVLGSGFTTRIVSRLRTVSGKLELLAAELDAAPEN